MTEQEIALLASFAPLAGIKGADSLLEALKGEGEDELTADVAANTLAEKIKANFAKVKETQSKRGSSDLKKSVLRSLKSEFPNLTDGIDDSGKITDFVSSFSQRAKAKIAEKPTDSAPQTLEITPELLEASPIAADFFSKKFSRKMEADRKALKDAQAALDKERREAKASTVKSKLTTLVAKRAKEMGVALEVDGVPSGLRLQKMLELSDFSNLSNWKVEGNEVVPIDATGNRAEDEMGNYLTLDDFIQSNNIYGTVKLNQEKSSPALKTSTSSANRGGKYAFKDQEDFAKQYASVPKGNDRKAILTAMLEAYEEQHPITTE